MGWFGGVIFAQPILNCPLYMLPTCVYYLGLQKPLHFALHELDHRYTCSTYMAHLQWMCPSRSCCLWDWCQFLTLLMSFPISNPARDSFKLKEVWWQLLNFWSFEIRHPLPFHKTEGEEKIKLFCSFCYFTFLLLEKKMGEVHAIWEICICSCWNDWL